MQPKKSNKKFLMLDIEVYPSRMMVGILNSKGNIQVLDGVTQIRRALGPVFRSPNNMWVTFNGGNYDMRILEAVIAGHNDPYKLSKEIINAGFEGKSWIKNHIDLMVLLPKIARASLKELGHRMGYSTLANLPFPYDAILTDQEWDEVIAYNVHDLKITKMLWEKLEPEYHARMALADVYDFHTLWSGAAGLAKKVFKLREVEMTHGIVEMRGLSDQIKSWDVYKEAYATLRGALPLQEKLDHIRDIGRNQTLKGVEFDLSVGGFHNKPKPGVYENIYEYDFSSLYPNLCIENNIGGASFNGIMRNLLKTRLEHKYAGRKAQSDAYKLIINSITGCFRDQYAQDSVFSVNSSLSMLLGGQFNMLDLIARLPEDMVILSNTDSIWCRERLPESFAKDVFERTGLVLEEERYDLAIVKDVNSVCCVRNGKVVKRKKEFLEPVYTHNVKAPVIQRAVLNYILYSTPIQTTMQEAEGKDFLFFTKGNKNTTLLLDGVESKEQRVRFYVSNEGQVLARTTKKSPSRVIADSNIELAMNHGDFDRSNLNVAWYEQRINDLLERIGVL